MGRDEEIVREYIRNQEKEDIRVDQLDLLQVRFLATLVANREAAKRPCSRFERLTLNLRLRRSNL